jgi:hypothetical protein
VRSLFRNILRREAESYSVAHSPAPIGDADVPLHHGGGESFPQTSQQYGYLNFVRGLVNSACGKSSDSKTIALSVVKFQRGCGHVS